MSTKKVFIFLSLIVIIGALLRFYKLDKQPFVTDEFLDINAAYGYYRTEKWVAWDFNLDQVSKNLYAPRDERAWIYRWQVAQLFRWLPPTESVARLVSVAWGLISIVTLYFVATYFTRKKIIGLIASFLFAVSISGIIFDRLLRMYAMFFPIFLLFSWFLFRFFEEEYKGRVPIIKKVQDQMGVNIIWFLPAVLTGLLSLHLHPLTFNIGIIFAIYLVIQAGISFYRSHSIFNKYTAVSVLALVVAVVLYIVDFKVVSQYSGVIGFSWRSSAYFFAAVSDYSNFILAYALIVLGIYSFRKDQEQFKRIIWLATCFFVLIAVATFLWKQSFGSRFIFFAMSFGIILLSSGMYYIADFVGNNSLKYRKQVFIGSLVFLLLAVPDYGYFFQKDNVYHQEEGKPDYRKTLGYFKKHHKAGDVLITRNFRSYYFRQTKVKVYDLDALGKLSLTKLKEIILLNPRGWAVFRDGKDNFQKDVLEYMKNNFEIKKEVNGVKVYKWGN